MTDLVPFTRTLPYVLRDRLKQDAAKTMVGKVVSVPDAKRVRIEIQGTQFTIPRLSIYTPTVGEPAFCVIEEGRSMVAIGAVGGAAGGQGPQGPPGPQGPKGDTGAQGPPGPSTSVPLVTVLPASPTDGQEVFFVASDAAGIVWHLRYRSASTSAHKWEFLGGPPLFNEVPLQEQMVTLGVWGNLPTVGPQITLPRPGEYDVEVAHRVFSQNNGASAYMSYELAGTPANGADGTDYFAGTSFFAAAGATTAVNAFKVRRKTLTIAGVLVQAKYQAAGAGAYFGQRTLRAIPIRIG